MIGYINKLADFFNGKDDKKAYPPVSDASDWVAERLGESRNAYSVPASLFWRSEPLGLYKFSNARSFSEFMETGNLESRLKHVPFDLFISEKHKLTFKVGDHPLQDGTTISDHVQRELREVSIEGMFSNHSVRKSSSSSQRTFKDDYQGLESKTMANTALEKFNEIKAIAEAKKPVRLVCSLDVYPKMIITELTYERESKNGSSITFSMTLREIETVTLVKTSSSYAYTPEQMESANSKMTASKTKSGKRSAEEKQAEEFTKLVNAEVLK